MTYLKFLNFQDFLLKKLVVFFDERCQSLDADFQLRADSERNSVLAGWLMASRCFDFTTWYVLDTE
jgi:hypothetical protein